MARGGGGGGGMNSRQMIEVFRQCWMSARKLLHTTKRDNDEGYPVRRNDICLEREKNIIEGDFLVNYYTVSQKRKGKNTCRARPVVAEGQIHRRSIDDHYVSSCCGLTCSTYTVLNVEQGSN
jgi:hypothetical protein